MPLGLCPDLCVKKASEQCVSIKMRSTWWNSVTFKHMKNNEKAIGVFFLLFDTFYQFLPYNPLTNLCWAVGGILMFMFMKRWNALSVYSMQGCSQVFSKGGHTVSNRYRHGVFAMEYCRLFALKKAYKGGGGHGHPSTPLTTPLVCVDSRWKN